MITHNIDNNIAPDINIHFFSFVNRPIVINDEAIDTATMYTNIFLLSVHLTFAGGKASTFCRFLNVLSGENSARGLRP